MNSQATQKQTESRKVGGADGLNPFYKQYQLGMQHPIPWDMSVQSIKISPNWACERCEPIDLGNLAQLDLRSLKMHPKGIVIAQIAELCNGEVRLRDPHCGICRTIFGGVAGADNRSEHTVIWELRVSDINIFPGASLGKVIPTSRTNSDILPCLVITEQFKGSAFDDPMLLYSSNLIFFHQKHSPAQILNPTPVSNIFDASFALRCIRECDIKHSSLCERMAVEVDGMMLLDCASLAIVPKEPNAEYVALSYVWVKRSSRNLEVTVDLNTLSTTILDAIKVTKDLGYQYLWIDKLCIDQKDEKKKLTQVLQMDTIYSGASITIIAASGDDETYGLSGISRSRNCTTPVNINDMKIFATNYQFYSDHLRSRWNTRAWTYQEGVLSTRRLIFTPNQVVFECNAMCCPEGISGYVSELDNSSHNTNELESFLFNYTSKLMQNLGGGGNAWLNYYKHIHMYTKRSLSHASDSFLAFAGIANQHELKKPPVYHLCGIPIASRLDLPDLLNVTNVTLSWGLSWYHDEYQPTNHVLTGGVTRRLGLPSWSWAGWGGSISAYRNPLYITRTRPLLELKAFTIGTQKYAVDDDFVLNIKSLLGKNQGTGVQSIFLDAFVFSGRELEILDNYGPLSSAKVKFEASEGFMWLDVEIDPNAALEKIKSQEWTLVGLAFHMVLSSRWSISFLVVEQMTQAFSRVGLLFVDTDADPAAGFIPRISPEKRRIMLV
jgi:heterokaryon incompatibility protein (HET)